MEQKISIDYSQAKPAFENLIKMVGELNDKFEKLLNNQALTKKTKEAKEQAREQEKALKQQENRWKTFRKALNVGGAVVGLWQIGKQTLKIAQEAINATETYNLFAVSLEAVTDEYGKINEASSKYYMKAIDFQNQMNEKLGTNKAELMEYQAMYFSMIKSQISDKDSVYKMSESLTKAGYDIASLYNLEVEDAMQKLQSGLAGQVEPLRKIGIDISESALSGILGELGIEKSVQQLSYGEKEVARYIAILRQAGQAQGDFARTIEQPANQLRIFKNQLAELKQVAGSFFMGIISNIMPYINGVVMALKEILKAIGSMFGIEFSGLSGNLGTTNEQISDIGTGIGSATKKAKEFQKQLMGWDEIHNITPPTESSSGGEGNAGSGVIDSRLLDAIGEWENKMDSVKNKAIEIRDKMLEWLGFVRNDDNTWKLGEGFNNFGKILEVVKGIGLAIGTWKITSVASKLLNALGIVDDKKGIQFSTGITLMVTGFWFLYNGTRHLIDGNWDLFTIIETMAGAGAMTLGIASALKATKLGKVISWGQSLSIGLGVTLAIQGYNVLTDGINKKDIGKTILGVLELNGGIAIPVATTIAPNLSKIKDGLGKLGDKIKSIDFKSLAGHIGTTTVGIAGFATSMYGAYEISKKFAEENTNTTTAIAELSLSMAGATASGALFWSQFGVIGTVIGGAVGLIASIGSAFLGMSSTMEQAGKIAGEAGSIYSEAVNEFAKHQEKMNEFSSSMEKQLSTLGQNAETVSVCKEKLRELVDENGNVVGSTENVESVLKELNETLGTNFQVVDGKIKNNDELMKSYNELSETIDEFSDEYVLNTLKEIAIDQKSTAIKRIVETKQAHEKALKAYEEYGEKMRAYMEEVDRNGVRNSKEVRENLKKMEEEYANLGKQVVTSTDEMHEAYVDFSSSTDEITLDLLQTTGLVNNLTEEGQKAVQKMIEDAKNGAEISIEQIKETIKNGTTDISENVVNTTQNISENTQNANSEINEAIGEASKRAIETTEQASQHISNAIGTATKRSIETAKTDGEQLAQEFKEMAQNSEQQFNQEISKLDLDTQANVLKALITTNGFKEEYVTAFTSLASNSTEQYNAILDELPEHTRVQLQQAVEKTQTTEQMMKDAVGLITKPFDWFKQTQLGQDGARIITEFKTGMEGQIENVKTGVGGIASTVTTILGQIDTTRIGGNIIEGLTRGINNTKWKLNSIVSGITNNIPTTIKNLLGIHSPSRVMMSIAEFIPIGMAKGIENEANTVYDSMAELSKGIEVSASDTALGMTVGVNRQIQQNIDTKATATVNGAVANNIRDIFTNAITSANVNVTIEAKTEEGVIVKKATQGIKDYVMQNGELPFPVLV